MHHKPLTMRLSTFKIFGEGAEVRGCIGAASPETDVRSQRLVTRGSPGERALVACGAQSCHLSSQHNHSISNAFVLLRDSYVCTVYCALLNKSLKLYVGTHA